MADKLEWMNRHAPLLRGTEWKPIAEREHYRVRADLRPMFDAHPDSLSLLEEFGRRGLYMEGCEFIARMIHRRAAVWWGYLCMLSLIDERREAGGQKRQTDELDQMLHEELKKAGLELKDLMPEKGADGMPGPLPELKPLKDMLSLKTPPQDDSGIKAASAALKAKTDRLAALIPPEADAVYRTSLAKTEAAAQSVLGTSPRAAFDAANAAARASRTTYTADYFNSPCVQNTLKMRKMLENMRQGIVAQIKGALPEKYPATPEAAMLFAAEKKKRSDDALQAVYRWIAAPDEVNSALALEAGNAAPGTPEGLLAYTAFWSFGDLAPEGKAVVPTPPELPGTGLKSALLLMTLASGGTRKAKERGELYFKLGLEVVFARNLWPDALKEEQAPHEETKLKSASAPGSAAPDGYRRWK